MPTPTLPPLPPVPANGFFIALPGEWNWLVKSLEAIYAALGIIYVNEEILMSTVADLKAAADKLAANGAALATEVGTLHTAVEGLITAFDNVKGGMSAADQATLDAAVGEVTNAATDLATQTGTLSSTEADTSAANPPAPAPAPTPAPAPAP